jgi:hypothetical protein
MPGASPEQEVACQQVLVDDSSVYSIQWSVFPAAMAAHLTPETLMKRYLGHIRRCTLTIICPTASPTGIEFRLFASRLSLISFLAPVTEQRDMVLRISGGALVQPRQCDRGELRFTVEAVEEGVKVALQLSEFCPLILGSPSPSLVRYWLYRLTQAAIHRLVTIRFLARLYRDLAGAALPVRVVNVRVREGRPV